MPVVEEYWNGVVRRLQAEVDDFNNLVWHHGERGRANELALTQVLQRLLPSSVGIGSGIVIDSNDRHSRQTDVVVYDRANQPSVLAQTTQVLFPVESVYLVIEVKSTLSTKELEDCFIKHAEMEELEPAGGHVRPVYALLAYTSGVSPAVISRKLRGDTLRRPQLLCVLSHGLVGGRIAPNDGDYHIGLAGLHLREEAGTRMSEAWDQPVGGEGDRVQRHGALYPSVKTGNRNRIVAEPGRALLLFCDALLRMMAQRGAIPEPSMSHYLTPVARELFSLQEQGAYGFDVSAT